VSNRTNKPPADNKSIIVEEIIYIKREIERDRASTTTTRRERERAKKNNANEPRRNWTSPCGTFLMLITRRLLPYVFITHTHTHTHTHGHIITSTIHITHQIPKEDQREEEKKSRARATLLRPPHPALHQQHLLLLRANLLLRLLRAVRVVLFLRVRVSVENWKIGEKSTRRAIRVS
jgi:hypothetical protein